MIRQTVFKTWEQAVEGAAQRVWRGVCGEGAAAADFALRSLFEREPHAGGTLVIENMMPLWCEAGGEALLGRPSAICAAAQRARRFGARPILVFGDSHSRHYLRRSRQGDEFLLPIGVVKTGASARGLIAQALDPAGVARSIAALRGSSHCLPMLFVFGQVDIEFIHAFRLAEAGGA